MDVWHTLTFSGAGGAAFVRGDLGKEKPEYSIECRRHAIDRSLRTESICNRTWFEHQKDR